MKAKYVEERYPELMIFGRNIEEGTVALCDPSFSLDVYLKQEDAEKIMEFYNKVQNKLVECAMAFSKSNPKEFTEFWYGLTEQGESS